MIVDEFHHAAAPSYEALLEHLQPVELLGLTATPERADGLDVLRYFDGRIAAELRLWDAIDQQYLAPFAYFGIHDGLDLRDVPWRRGQGYDVDALTNVFTADHAWARRVVEEVRRKVDDPPTMRALGFCVERRPRAVHGRSGSASRPPVGRDLGRRAVRTSGRARCATSPTGRSGSVFTVDLFNEGVDIPTVDTLLLLRPTESPTLFLQQLGRGLRKAHGKSVCTVLDFVGTHRKEFRFDRRFRALLGGSRADVERQVQQDFPFLPAGCSFELDPVAQEIVLGSIRDCDSEHVARAVRRASFARRRRARRVPREQRPRARGHLRRRPQLVGDAARGGLADRAGGPDEDGAAARGRSAAPRRRRGAARGLPAASRGRTRRRARRADARESSGSSACWSRRSRR